MAALLLALALVWPQAVHSTTGVASYYADAKMPQGSFYAAMPGYRYGHPFYVWVHPYGQATPRIRVRVSDSCQCYVGTRDARVIDLSWHLFLQFSPSLKRGLVKVVVER